MLTGKAKKDFYNWINDKGYHEEVVYKSVINCLIIEWFDSVGIYVSPNYEEYIDYSVRGLPVKIKNWFCWVNEELLTGFSSRQQATEQAIIKANEMYNSQ